MIKFMWPYAEVIKCLTGCGKSSYYELLVAVILSLYSD